MFLNSLAESHGDAAIGVVLSGGDPDGTLGVQAIKHHGGITFAQASESARFPGMPQHAIETDCVDFVLRPSEIVTSLIPCFPVPTRRHSSTAAVPKNDSRACLNPSSCASGESRC